MTEPKPWRRALVWLLFLGPFFFASYGFANWLASQRVGVGAVVFEWERVIPFIPWTIVPYWSIDILYVLSLFVCTTRQELDRHAQRLLAVQLISIAFFIDFPLRFSFDKPDVKGVFGALFAALGSFDKPFNQAPSLHIGLLVLIWFCFWKHCRPTWRWALHLWMTLIGLSILTTYQHHFVDLPTGVLAGCFVLWLLPDESPSPLWRLVLTADPGRRTLAVRYALGAIAFCAVAFLGGVWLWMLWPAIALGFVALIYAAVGERGFQKGRDGRLSVGAHALFMPYIAAAWINSRLWTLRHPLPSEVVEGVWIGRNPRRSEILATRFTAIVDLAAELPSHAPMGVFYRSIPVLDLTVADAGTLKSAAESIEEGFRRGPVLVCCALGYSRSAAAVVAWLLVTRRADSVEVAMQMVRKARPAIVLNVEHRAMLEGFA